MATVLFVADPAANETLGAVLAPSAGYTVRTPVSGPAPAMKGDHDRIRAPRRDGCIARPIRDEGFLTAVASPARQGRPDAGCAGAARQR